MRYWFVSFVCGRLLISNTFMTRSALDDSFLGVGQSQTVYDDNSADFASEVFTSGNFFLKFMAPINLLIVFVVICVMGISAVPGKFTTTIV